MHEQSIKNKQIINNSVFLYVRMLLAMFVGLYTSRVTLQALGVEDFGIYNVIGGVVSMIVFFTSSLSNASQRFLSIGIGKGDDKETLAAFKQSYTLLLIVSIFVLIIGETLGLWFVINKLVIPLERLHTALWVYHFSLVSVVLSIIQVTFLALIIAYEKMKLYAYIGLFEVFARLFIAYLLCVVDTDHLFLYGLLNSLLSVFVLLFYIIFCKKKYIVCQCSLLWNRDLVKEMSSFIGYTFFGCFAWSVGIQGINIILNMFFGPVVNAARGISVQVSNIVVRFTDSITTAVKPQIIKSYASNDIEYMILLIEKSSKYGLLFTVIIVTPILFEAKYILELWLGKVPDYTVSFVRVVICEQLIAVLVPPLSIAANATGKIKNIQFYGRIITLFSLPIALVMLSFYPIPIISMYVLIITQLLYWLFCLYDIHIQLKLSIKHYFKVTIFPILFVFIPLLFINWLIVIYASSSFIRLLCITIATISIGVVLIYLILEESEKKYFKKLLFKYKLIS